VLPWFLLAVVVVPLLIVAFAASRRSTKAGEHPSTEDAEARARTEAEFAQAEEYEREWHEQDRKRRHPS
jgi:hypothetical protein